MTEHKNSDGLRNRRPAVAASMSGNETTKTPHPSFGAAIYDLASDAIPNSSHLQSNRRTNMSSIILVLKWILHIAAIACFVTGIILRTNRLHNGDECDMTYSMRVFLKVEILKDDSTMMNPATSNYGLYKFVDQRDPRYTQLRRKAQTRNLLPNEHCVSSSDTIVIYVPGHWGTYDQARSLGAHGIGLTRAREPNAMKTQQLLLGGNFTSKENFVYDVYSVDFAEQGGGLHGQFLNYQADYLHQVLKKLKEDCSSKKMIVVAHSMGGYVASKVLLEHPELNVDNLITLATPHSNPLYAFDRSVSKFTTLLRKDFAAKPLIVSISGGLRDEMIDPSVCQVPSPKESSWSFFGEFSEKVSEESFKPLSATSWTVLATNLVGSKEDSGAHRLGMDHRAIVWCHQLLEEVREILWVLVAFSDSTVPERLEKIKMVVGNKQDYVSDLIRTKKWSVEGFGSIPAICMESSMIYNLPYLLALYASQVGFRCACFTPWVTIGLGWIFRSDLSLLSTVILALVANSFNLLVLRLVPKGFLLLKRKQPLQTLQNALFMTLALVFVIMIGSLTAFCWVSGIETKSFVAQKWFGLLTSTLYVYAIATIYVMLIVRMGFIEIDSTKITTDKNKSNIKNDKNSVDANFEAQLITFVMMVVPFLFAGSLVLMAWEQNVQMSSWGTVFSLQIPVGILTLIRLHHVQTIGSKSERATTKDRLMVRSILISLVLFAHFWCGLFSRGTGYLVPNLAILLVWVGIMDSLLL